MRSLMGNMFINFWLGFTTWRMIGRWIWGHPTYRCHCGWPTVSRNTGDIVQHVCPFGNCAYNKYQKI